MSIPTIMTILYWVLGTTLYFYLGYLYLNTPKIRKVIRTLPAMIKKKFDLSDDEVNTTIKISILIMWIFWFIGFVLRLIE
ncbi:MAG: hypothetical protein NT098_04435 [Candidatus Parcubacteria bacterium]|nr:hypothetical protein [Candidatus Parcubacteria bacterium]